VRRRAEVGKVSGAGRIVSIGSRHQLTADSHCPLEVRQVPGLVAQRGQSGGEHAPHGVPPQRVGGGEGLREHLDRPVHVGCLTRALAA